MFIICQITTTVGYVMAEMKRLIKSLSEVNRNRKDLAQQDGKDNPLGTVQKIKKLTMMTNDICTNQNLSLKIRHIKLSGTLRYKQINKNRPHDEFSC